MTICYVPAAENTLRLLPPLTISEEEIDLAIAKIVAALNAMPKTAVNKPPLLNSA